MKKKRIIPFVLLPFFLIGCGYNGESSISISSSEPSIESSSIESSEIDSSYLSSEESSLEESSIEYSSSEYSSEESTSIPSSSEYSSEESSSYSSSSEVYTVPDYVLHGQFNGSKEWTDKAMSKNTSREYMIIGVKLYQNDVFKIHMGGKIWYGYSDIKKDAGIPKGLVSQAPSDDNIRVVTTGIYDIYSSYDESSGGHIYLTRTDTPPTPSTISVTGISLDRSSKFLEVRHEFTLVANVLPFDAANKEVYWSSSDTSIATVTTAGTVKAQSKTGNVTITAKTLDGNKIATCLVYVSASPIPDYFLTGVINGREYKYGTYTYAGVPYSTGKYLISSVRLKSGDYITVALKNGGTLKDKYNQTYKYEVKKDMYVDVYLNVNDSNKNYLTFEDR